MNVFLGIDLGSTTSKAVIVDGEGHIIGRGITNTRSNYEVAAQIAQNEAEFNSRFTLLHRKLKSEPNGSINWDELINQLENRFHYLQYRNRFNRLLEKMYENASHLTDKKLSEKIIKLLKKIQNDLLSEVEKKFIVGAISLTSEFFRDLFSTGYMKAIQNEDKDYYDQLVALYDRSITPVENEKLSFDFTELAEESIELLPQNSYQKDDRFRKHLEDIEALSLEPTDYIGTGYGRQLLPFEEQHIKSEILCHAMGAHACFPETRTVLDIGGQDTKAIQVDKYGLVTSFQMNDRCAAGCGRYLGYIADEMSISVGELGPLAMNADHEANICSTCTVFAGAELREYLNLGEKKENILAGLHKAIVQRAFALLARSGGVRNEFTFTGGVARNQAVVKYVSQMVEQNYGKLKINCHTDSIFMGALGAALFSSRRK
jgi:benzoyl-CoA reductase subunit A